MLCYVFPPPARWGSLDFIRVVSLLLLLLLLLWQPRISTASSRSQWALPNLKRELQISVGTAGPQRLAQDVR